MAVPGVALAVLLGTGVGCAVKPPMRYVAPDGTLHETLRQRRPPPPGEGARAEPGPAPIAALAPPLPGEPEDPYRAHYATAVGLQAACRYGEALSYYRGYLEAAPAGAHAAGSLVHMAEIYLDPGYHGGDDERARTLLQEVVARFPETAAASVAREMLGQLSSP